MLNDEVSLNEASAMAKQVIWISFDLGIRGDYENLYAWLDEHGAKECGDNFASIIYRRLSV